MSGAGPGVEPGPAPPSPSGVMLCVGLMVTCVNDAMFPEVGRAVVSLLRRLDVDVDFPMSQTCCAQPMVNTGYLDLAVPVVRTFVSAFADYDAIVTPSGSCAGSARHQHGVVARRSGDPSLVAAVERTGPRVHELSEFLVDVLGVRVGRSRSTSATCVMSTPRTPSGCIGRGPRISLHWSRCSTTCVRVASATTSATWMRSWTNSPRTSQGFVTRSPECDRINGNLS